MCGLTKLHTRDSSIYAEQAEDSDVRWKKSEGKDDQSLHISSTRPGQHWANVLKELAGRLVKAFMTIYSKLIAIGQVPEDWKGAYVTSIFIKGQGAAQLTVLLASSWGCVNRLGRSYVTQGDKKICNLPPLPPCQCSREETPVGSRIFLTLPLPGRHHLLLAGAGRTQPIRMEETYTPTMMKPVRVGICDK